MSKKKEKSNDVIQYITIEDISPSELNPRKTFDEESLSELAQNIREQGILQPITVRNIPLGFEIICGERRYRAAKIAELETVPCIIRDMSDEEAFDVMITENLQRKDVEPLEEAAAFKQLIEKRGYDIENLCTRFGKSEKYIRIRLKLNDLIEPFRELLAKDIIKIGHASEIVKLPEDGQQALYEDDFEDRENGWWECPTVSDLKDSIEDSFLKIKNALFSTKECKTCTKNTASNGCLFPDLAKDQRCTDEQCYQTKTIDFIVKKAEKLALKEPDTLIVCAIRYSGLPEDQEEAEAIISKLNELNIDVDKDTDYKRCYSLNAPSEPERPNHEDYEEEESYQEDLEIYEEELKEYPEKLRQYNDKIESGRIKKGFYINGNRQGNIEYFEVKASDKPDVKSGIVSLSITDLETKDKRNAEIKHEKTFEEAKELLRESDYLTKTAELSSIEIFALNILHLAHGDYDIMKKYKADGYRVNADDFFKVIETLTAEDFNLIARSFIEHSLINSFQYEKYTQHLLIEIAKDKYPEQLKEIEDKHQATYLKRKNGIEKKIEQAKKEAKEKSEIHAEAVS